MLHSVGRSIVLRVNVPCQATDILSELMDMGDKAPTLTILHFNDVYEVTRLSYSTTTTTLLSSSS